MNIDIKAELAKLPPHSRGRAVLERIAKEAMTRDLRIDWLCQEAVAEAVAAWDEALEVEPMLGDVAFLKDIGLA